MSDKETLPTMEQRVRRARSLLRVIWQGYDASGHSCGRSRTCAYLELAMSLIGLPDPKESQIVDQGDLNMLVAEAKEWISAIAEDQYDRYWDAGESQASKAIAGEIETGFENRMR